ncbi:putative baseplate assembly protein [Deinococcus sp. Arct2-2]|uniref:putative baseplate assembly protein n=1 Tax=Deinococcus sp. Arct2-2 TaxID=2568653 RepID=UPI0010A4CC6C|nr:putative baseplate assembly protein [Deinococcus sp. Arct2-2]THF69546.1 putative baseplate assembly protein [Deinococcus sp. Arct2-2]
MPLPTVNLDDRRFDDLLDEAKRLIPVYCPEWTDHNASDPGIALLEVFAWMTDLMLARVNQVPQKMFITFLEMIGLQLDPPRAATAPVTFYLSAPQDTPLMIAAGTEVATIRTEVSEATVFSTEQPLTVRPPELLHVYGANTVSADNQFVRHDLGRLSLPGQKFPVFSPQPVPGDAFLLAFGADLSHHVLALVLTVEVAGGAGVNPQEPPFVWEAWQGGAQRWVPCEVEYDGTAAFNVPGELILRLPTLQEGEFFGQVGYWLRCRLTSEQNYSGYKVSPDVEAIRAESRGATVAARHATVVYGELLGESDGNAGQTFKLMYGPVLSPEADQDVLEVFERPGSDRQGETTAWTPVTDFSDSGADDRHFRLDLQDGTVTFGPTLLQPDGSVYRFGAVPPAGTGLRMRRYSYSGGVLGNVPERTLSVLKSSIPYVARVVNHKPATGGRNAQSLEDAIQRVPRILRTRTRAVTRDDYEFLAEQMDGVARARCLTANTVASAASYPGNLRAVQVPAGRVTLVVLPALPPASDPAGKIAPESLTLSAELRTQVQALLDDRRPIGTILELRQPQYVWLSVTATLRANSGASRGERESLRRAAEAALYAYLNPYMGGPEGTGWPFGRTLGMPELYGLLRGLRGAEVVEDIQVVLTEPGQPQQHEAVAGSLNLPPQAVIVSDIHRVEVEG